MSTHPDPRPRKAARPAAGLPVALPVTLAVLLGATLGTALVAPGVALAQAQARPAAAAAPSPFPKRPPASDPVALGRYLVKTTGCNDCHTPGYAPMAGKVPESQWLIGDRLGFRGPWGTSYPTNLRLSVGTLSSDQWIERVRTLETRPPMPWFVLRDMSEDDLRAIWAYIRAAGPAGDPAPAALPPGAAPQGPVVQFPG